MLCALGFILSIVWVPGWTGGAIPTGWIVLSAVLPFLLKPIEMNSSHWLGLSFLIFAGLGLLWTPYPLEGIQSVWQLVIFAMAFWFGSQEENLEPLFFGLGLGLICINLPIAIAQHFGWQGVGFVFRPAGLFFNPITLASVTVLVIVGLLVYKRYVMATMLAPLLVLSGSRVSIPVLGAIGFLQLSHRGQVTLSLLSLVGVVLAISLIDRPYLPRLEIWYMTILDLNIFGHGPGSYLYLTPSRLTSAHSDLLEIAYLYGIGSILLVLALINVENIHVPEFHILLAFGILAIYSSPLSSPVAGFVGLVCAGYLALPRRNSVYRRSTLPKGMATPVGVYDQTSLNHLPL